MIVVGVGTSLGGLDALRILLRELPADSPLAIAIAQHRAPQADTALIELIGRQCALPVCEPCDGDPLQPGHIYIAPPDYHLLIEPAADTGPLGGAVSLSIDAPVNHARPSIDVLFESLARAYAERAVAFVLTGASADGAAGAAEIKRAGGRVFVEDPDFAHSPIAPRATLATLDPDAVLPLERLASVLAHLGEPATVNTRRPSHS